MSCFLGVLVRVSIAVKRHHDNSDTYTGKTFNWGGLHFQRFSPLSSCCTGRHDAGEVAESPESTIFDLQAAKSADSVSAQQLR